MITVNNMSVLKTIGQHLHAGPAPKATIYSYPAVNAVYISKEVGEKLYKEELYKEAAKRENSFGPLYGNSIKMPNGTEVTVVTDTVTFDPSGSPKMVGGWFIADSKSSIEEQAKSRLSLWPRVIALYVDTTDPAKHKVVMRAFDNSGELGVGSQEGFAISITVDGEPRTQLTRRQFKKFARGLRDGTVEEPEGRMFVPDMSYTEMARKDPYSPQNLAFKLAPVVLIGGAVAEVILIDGKRVTNWATHRAGPWISENSHRLGIAIATMPATTAVAIGAVVTAGALFTASVLLRKSSRSSYDEELSPNGTAGTA